MMDGELDEVYTAATAGHTRMGSFLGRHYGDGLIYLTEPGDRALLCDAMAGGLVTAEGYLTSAGYRYWRNHGET